MNQQSIALLTALVALTALGVLYALRGAELQKARKNVKAFSTKQDDLLKELERARDQLAAKAELFRRNAEHHHSVVRAIGHQPIYAELPRHDERDTDQIAASLNVSPSTIQRWTNDNRIPYRESIRLIQRPMRVYKLDQVQLALESGQDEQ